MIAMRMSQKQEPRGLEMNILLFAQIEGSEYKNLLGQPLQ